MIRELFLQDLSLWECLWQSTIFLALGLAAGRRLRGHPSRAYAALLVAMTAAALVPFLSAAVRHAQLGAFPAAPEESTHVLLAPPESTLEQSPPARPARDVPRSVSHAEPTPSLLTPPSIPWRTIALSAWLLATLLLVARLIVMFVYGACLVRQARRSGCEEIQQAADATASRLRLITRLQVRTSDRIRSPVVWCWTHPPVLLVPHARGRADVEWTGVVAHELAHCQRRDHVTGLVAELAASLMPWNPLLWVARRLLIRLGEQACDDWVVASGQSSEDYAESLLRFRPQKQMAFWPAVVSSRGGLAHRIRRILNDACGNPHAGAKWALTLGLAALGIGLGVAFAQTRPASSATSTKPEETSVPSLDQGAATGDLEQVKKLLAQGSDVHAKDKDGRTPLHSAAWYGRKDVAAVLLARGANVNEADGSGKTPLHLAADFGEKLVPELLLAQGAQINARDNAGNTPLHAATRLPSGRTDLLELLIAKGADVRARNEAGETPLHLVSKRRGQQEDKRTERAAEVLLAHGAEVDAKDKSGCTPLHFAVENGHKELGDLLVAKGADVRAKAADGTTLLHRAVKSGQIEMVEWSLSRGIDVSSAPSDGRTALHLAASTGKNNIVEALIARGADVEARDGRGETPAGLAARMNHKDTVRLLLEKGAEVSTIYIAACLGDLGAVKGFLERAGNVTAQDKYLTPTLSVAALAGQKDVAAFLISNGASVNVEDVGGARRSALHYAAVGGSKEVAELLIAHGAKVNAKAQGDMTPLHQAARSGAKDVAELLIAHGAEVNAKAQGDMTPLHWAARSGAKDVVLLLIDHGADINAKVGQWKEGPLDLAVWARRNDVARLLIDKGADPSRPDLLLHLACGQVDKDLAELLIRKGADVNYQLWNYGPAMAAMWSGYTSATKPADVPRLLGVLRLLLDHGADPDGKDRWDWTLLHYACDCEEVDLAKLLLDRGANPNAVASGDVGRRPLHWAAERGRTAVVELLISRGADVNARDNYGHTALSYAEDVGDTDIFGRPRKPPLTTEAKAAKKETAGVLRKHGAKE